MVSDDWQWNYGRPELGHLMTPGDLIPDIMYFQELFGQQYKKHLSKGAKRRKRLIESILKVHKYKLFTKYLFKMWCPELGHLVLWSWGALIPDSHDFTPKHQIKFPSMSCDT